MGLVICKGPPCFLLNLYWFVACSIPISKLQTLLCTHMHTHTHTHTITHAPPLSPSQAHTQYLHKDIHALSDTCIHANTRTMCTHKRRHLADDEGLTDRPPVGQFGNVFRTDAMHVSCVECIDPVEQPGVCLPLAIA